MFTYRFGVFAFDVSRLELSRDGRPARLQRQPAQVLAALLVRAGQLVTRDELRRAVWPDDTFVDFDRGLNFCIAQIRAALSDDAATPRYIRTLPKKGYEFIYPVEVDSTDPAVATTQDLREPRHGPFRGSRSMAIVVVTALAAVGAAMYVATAARRASLPVVAVARFDNETSDPALTQFGDNLTDTLVERLTAESGGQYGVVGNAAILRQPRERRDLAAIASSLRVGYVILGQIQRDDQRLRILAHLIRLPDQTHITVSRIDGVGDKTLTATDDAAIKIAREFSQRLRELGLPRTSHERTTR